MERVNIIGIRSDGTSEIVGTAAMPPRMKMRAIVRDFFGEPNEEDPMACDEATMCLAAMEAYHHWLLDQGWGPLKAQKAEVAAPPSR